MGRSGCSRHLGNGKESVVLLTSSHRMPNNACTCSADCQTCGATSSTGSSTASASSATTSASNDLVPLRLQCRVFQLGERMASRQENLLLPTFPQRLCERCTNSSACNNFLALRLQCWLPQLLSLLDKAMVCWKACLVLSTCWTWLPDFGPTSMMFYQGVLIVQFGRCPLKAW